MVSSGVRETLDHLRLQEGKDIWLFGGGELFRSLLELGCVDTVELAVVPILLGTGRSFLPAPAPQRRLVLRDQQVYHQSGIVLLTYDVLPPAS